MKSRDWGRRKELSGHFPEYGAIFMSNRSTFKECLEKRLLGLPSPFSSFVKSVKAGMTLFLFEFEERKLYGVFEAISDGGMNIVPHAYISSGKKFPAQVKFTTIWHCHPLLEYEFRDAIRDNYFDTYKFNFGLSKDQTESLLWLFDSKKLEIPKSLHHNSKRKSRIRHCKSTAAGQKKGRSTHIQVSKRKSNMNHGISVVSLPEVKRLSSSSDSCRRPESIHLDVDAYDPEYPAFHYSEGSGTHSAANHESHEHLALKQKEGKSSVPTEESQDYIPLFPSDHSDSEEEELDFSECSVMTSIEFGIVGNQVSSIPVPQFAHGHILSNKGSNSMKMELLLASTHGSSRYKLDDSSNAALPLADTRDFKSEDGSSDFKSVQTKGTYSDKSKPRASVFSRLNFSSKYAASENHEECEKVKNVTQQKHVIGDGKVNKRASVFSRFTGASDAIVQPGHCMTELQEEASKWKKGKERRSFQNGNITA